MSTNETIKEATKVRGWYGDIAHVAMVVPFSLNGACPTLTAICGTKVVRATKLGVEKARPCEKCGR